MGTKTKLDRRRFGWLLEKKRVEVNEDSVVYTIREERKGRAPRSCPARAERQLTSPLSSRTPIHRAQQP